mmetsp:Transcript_3101/g.7185  ORF Transcript_3101/g.7185 Transcript_3101/m.7185 type:complete len:339 (-) Transcript_3101:3035-4051(-)
MPHWCRMLGLTLDMMRSIFADKIEYPSPPLHILAAAFTTPNAKVRDRASEQTGGMPEGDMTNPSKIDPIRLMSVLSWTESDVARPAALEASATSSHHGVTSSASSIRPLPTSRCCASRCSPSMTSLHKPDISTRATIMFRHPHSTHVEESSPPPPSPEVARGYPATLLQTSSPSARRRSDSPAAETSDPRTWRARTEKNSSAHSSDGSTPPMLATSQGKEAADSEGLDAMSSSVRFRMVDAERSVTRFVAASPPFQRRSDVRSFSSSADAAPPSSPSSSAGIRCDTSRSTLRTVSSPTPDVDMTARPLRKLRKVDWSMTSTILVPSSEMESFSGPKMQ